jgi:hypothetical protein
VTREAGPISRWLAADHVRLDGLLRRATARPDAIDLAPYSEFRRGLLRHIGIEEKIVMPAARRALGGEALAHEARLRLDHGAIAAMLVPTPSPAIVATLRDVLAGHNALEEGPHGLYAACDRVLGDRADVLVAEMAARPEPPVNPHNDAPEVMLALRRALERAGYRLRDDGSRGI